MATREIETKTRTKVTESNSNRKEVIAEVTEDAVAKEVVVAANEVVAKTATATAEAEAATKEATIASVRKVINKIETLKTKMQDLRKKTLYPTRQQPAGDSVTRTKGSKTRNRQTTDSSKLWANHKLSTCQKIRSPRCKQTYKQDQTPSLVRRHQASIRSPT